VDLILSNILLVIWMTDHSSQIWYPLWTYRHHILFYYPDN